MLASRVMLSINIATTHVKSGHDRNVGPLSQIKARKKLRLRSPPPQQACVDLATGHLNSLLLVPLQIHRFGLRWATQEFGDWLAQAPAHESHPFGVHIQRSSTGSSHLPAVAG